MDKRQPRILSCPVRVTHTASFGGRLEGKGPLSEYLDGIVNDEGDRNETWEENESSIVERTVSRLVEKIGSTDGKIDLLCGGDLMNQCTSSAYGLEGFDIPYLGLYGACSTFAEGILVSSAFIESGACDNAIASASSHFCTAERQYRFPLGYGAFPQGTSQHTVTGCGAAFLERTEKYDEGVYIKGYLPGIVINRGITNAANMGAAMATAAADTIMRYLEKTGTSLSDYDMIATGDLGKIGLEMLKDMLSSHGYTDERSVLTDCGILVYDLEKQDVSCGGSGCGCSAITFCGYIHNLLSKGVLHRVLLVGTGAMMSPQALLQGKSIPAVAHLVEFTKGYSL